MAPAATPETIASLRATLASEETPLSLRFRALFALKHTASATPPTALSIAAIDAIAAALFTSPSALLKHELAYCLGQTRNLHAQPPLERVLRDRKEDGMCRHEAAEALGALGSLGSVELLKERRDDLTEEVVVRETCEIAVDRITWEHDKAAREAETVKKSDFASIDPAPPMPNATKAEAASIAQLEHALLDTDLPLFQRYRAMFALRDLASPPDLPTAEPAVLSLAKGFADPSALFRHEVAFVFGQLSHPASIPSLTRVLANLDEASMVRHEAAEALGSLGEEDGVEETLRKFLNDPEQVVRESVVVALDMAEYEKSGQADYALMPQSSHSLLVASS